MKFVIKKAREEDYSSLVDLIMYVQKTMPEKQAAWLAVDEPDHTLAQLYNGQMIGYKAVDTITHKMAGIFTIVFPGKETFNLGYDLGMTEDELLKVVHMDTAAILPEYRGHGLQKYFMEMIEEELRQEGYRYLCCTAHPDNKYSCNNILANGYQVMMTKEKYGGFLRHIFLKMI